MRPRYASRRAYHTMESALVGARSYAAFASASCDSYRALVSAGSGSVRSVSPRNEIAWTPGGSGDADVAVLACSRGVELHAVRTTSREERRRITGWLQAWSAMKLASQGTHRNRRAVAVS